MQLRYNFRLYPSAGQRVVLSRAFGCARVVFNDGLRVRRDAHTAGLPYIPDGVLSRRVITEAKRTPERAWLGEVSAVVLQQALADLNTAYRNFINSVTGKRKGRRVAPPRFRSRKDNRQAVRFTKNSRFTVLPNGKLRLPKVGDVPVRWSRSLPSDPSSVTVVRDAAGRYFASFVVQVDDARLPPVDADVGIDLGLKHFAVLSNGRKVDNARYLRNAERRLRRAQQTLCRKAKGSANRAKARIRVARLHARVRDTRRDFHHKLSTTLIRENQAVYVEDLAVAGLARTRLAKSVHDAGWAGFLGMLEYKAVRHGRTFTRISRWFPSSKQCSHCHTVVDSLPLTIREWTCPGCGTVHDRDLNASTTIRAEGRRIVAAGRAETKNACGGTVRPSRQEGTTR
ncbi:MAG TPA: RNA-guided endonuclease TnpB family protein [Mycobacteriales bacterium]|nr:RNA-guided endonuclease TnpB family protein [Mycobacteriales bacterium]